MLFDKVTVLRSRTTYLKDEPEGSSLLVKKKGGGSRFAFYVRSGDQEESIKKIGFRVLRGGRIKSGEQIYGNLNEFLNSQDIAKEKIHSRGNYMEEDRIRYAAEKDLGGKEDDSVKEYSRKAGIDKNWQAYTWLAVKKNGVITLHKIEHSKEKTRLNLSSTSSLDRIFRVAGGERSLKGLQTQSDTSLLLRGKMITSMDPMEHRVIKQFKSSSRLLTPIIYEKEGKERFVIERKNSDLAMLIMKPSEASQSAPSSSSSPPHGSFTPKQILSVFHNIALAVKEMHDNNTVHFDLKPSNILIDYNKENPGQSDVHLIDFGQTHIYDDPETSMSKHGTAGYFDPSFSLFGVDNLKQGKAVDIYSLGISLISLLAKKEFTTIHLEKGKGFMWHGKEYTSLSDILARTALGPMMGMTNPPPIDEVLMHFLGGEADPQMQIDTTTLQFIATMLRQPIEARPDINKVIEEVDRLINSSES